MLLLLLLLAIIHDGQRGSSRSRLFRLDPKTNNPLPHHHHDGGSSWRNHQEREEEKRKRKIRRRNWVEDMSVYRMKYNPFGIFRIVGDLL